MRKRDRANVIFNLIGFSIIVVLIVSTSGCAKITDGATNRTVKVTEILGQSYNEDDPWGGEFTIEDYYLRFNDSSYGHISISECPFLRVNDTVVAWFYGNKSGGHLYIECPENRK